MKIDAKKIGSRIRFIRESLDLSQKDFAALIDSSSRTIQDNELGKSIPKGNTLAGIANLGFNTNWILTGNGEMKLACPAEDFPLLTNLPLLESITRAVDKHFGVIKMPLPESFRGNLVIEIYRIVQSEDIELSDKVIMDSFTKCLSANNGA